MCKLNRIVNVIKILVYFKMYNFKNLITSFTSRHFPRNFFVKRYKKKEGFTGIKREFVSKKRVGY